MRAGLDLLTPGAPSGMTRTTLSGWAFLSPQLVGGWSLYSLEARAQEDSQRSCRDLLKLEQQVIHPKFYCVLLLIANHRLTCVWRNSNRLFFDELYGIRVQKEQGSWPFLQTVYHPLSPESLSVSVLQCCPWLLFVNLASCVFYFFHCLQSHILLVWAHGPWCSHQPLHPGSLLWIESNHGYSSKHVIPNLCSTACARRKYVDLILKSMMGWRQRQWRRYGTAHTRRQWNAAPAWYIFYLLVLWENLHSCSNNVSGQWSSLPETQPVISPWEENRISFKGSRHLVIHPTRLQPTPPTLWREARALGHHQIGLSSSTPQESREFLSPKAFFYLFPTEDIAQWFPESDNGDDGNH